MIQANYQSGDGCAQQLADRITVRRMSQRQLV